MTVSTNVTLRRIKLGLTMPQLADIVGCHKSTVYRIETGSTNPSKGMVMRFADALGCKYEDLVR